MSSFGINEFHDHCGNAARHFTDQSACGVAECQSGANLDTMSLVVTVLKHWRPQ
jgi:hypothetical protein